MRPLEEEGSVSEDSIDNDDETPDQEAIDWIRNKITLPFFDPQNPRHWSEDYEMIVSDFLASPQINRLLVFMDGRNDTGGTESSMLILETQAPPPPSWVANDTMQYFLKDRNRSYITLDDTKQEVQYGMVTGNRLDSLLRMMNRIYLPTIIKNRSWPESVRKDLCEKLHKFMAALTETTNQQKGHTVLYVPEEGIETRPLEESANDSELVRRLESTLIHWTRQIEEMVKNQAVSQQNDEGPLEEIAFWRARTVDLVSVQDQLDRKDVQNIVAVLRNANSTYLDRFDTLAGSIEMGSQEANDNLKFLSTLASPCEKLATVEPENIKTLLPEIIHIIRMIWSTSQFYCTQDRLTGLLRRVSNQVIIQCRKVINLNEIYDGNVLQIMDYLRDSEACGVKWREVYNRTVRNVKKAQGDGVWKVDPSSIFAQIDAFIQRCKDLLSVCEGQLQFCRKDRPMNEKTKRRELPTFGGARGLAVEKALYEIEDAFVKHIERLKHLKYDILDVNTTAWHEDYTYFKSGVKDLEVMMTNVINTAFEGIQQIQDAVELLTQFMGLAKRESMRLIVERKVADVYQLAKRSAMQIKKDFDQNSKEPPIMGYQPKWGGAGLWAIGLRSRLEGELRALKDADLLPNSKDAIDAFEQQEMVLEVLSVYLKEKHTEWDNHVNELEVDGLVKRLDKSLLSPEEDTTAIGQRSLMRVIDGRLVCNFDHELLRVFNETLYWEKKINQAEYQVPFAARKMYESASNLRLIRENVMLVVRDFNLIIEALSFQERKLFHEYMKRVDKRLGPGLSKFTWNKKYIKEVFVKRCRRECAEVYDVVKGYHAHNRAIRKTCSKIRRLIMVDIDSSQPSTVHGFKEKQIRHLLYVKKLLNSSHAIVTRKMKDNYKYFEGHPENVMQQWQNQITHTDEQIENALRTSVKKSLQELARSINGDGKNDPSPIFKVAMVLDSRTSKVDFTPTIVDLTHMVSCISRQLMETVKVVPRMTKTLLPEDKVDPDQRTLYQVISTEDAIIKCFVTIMQGISDVAVEIGNMVTEWEQKYKQIWDMDKDKFINRMAHTKHPLSSYEKHITRYKMVEQDIHHEESTYNAKFIHVDCSDLKKTLVEHCKSWQSKVTGLLKKKATDQLTGIIRYFESNSLKIEEVPTNLEELGAGIGLVQKLKSEFQMMEDKFAPLEAMFTVLEKFDVQTSEKTQELLDQLRPMLEEFQGKVAEAGNMLQKSKQNMRASLQSELEKFSRHIETLRQDFLEAPLITCPLPDEGEPDIDGAFKIMHIFKKQLQDGTQRAANIKIGLDIFGIEQPSYKVMTDTTMDLKNLNIIWTILKLWKTQWNIWKQSKFKDLDPKEMDKEAQEYFVKIMKLRKWKDWEVWQAAKLTVERFRATMPLINNLRNPSMRERHWEQLKQVLENYEFDPYSDDFTMETINKLELHKFSEQIENISSIANKEQNIENAIAEIEEIWGSLLLDIGPYKEIYSVLLSTEEVIQHLEDNQVQMSTMRNSPFFETFSKQINKWVKKLADIGEVIETTVQLTKQWMYLESIFKGSEEIRRQLPKESVMFDKVNLEFTYVMEDWSKVKIVQECALVDGLHSKLLNMKNVLEKVQRSLSDYLETKRMAFPRFYFLSDDDLLEILGNSQAPEKLQKHTKKLFAGLHCVTLKAPRAGIGGTRNWEALGMKDSSGEEVLFLQPVVIQGAVEEWMTVVEKNMRICLQKQLQTTLNQIANPKRKREGWVKSSVGQMLILSGQVSWTTECVKALNELVKNRKALRKLRKVWKKYLERCAVMIRGDLSKLNRKKLVALITIEVHARDVIERMMKSTKCTDTSAFEWTSQLRFEYVKDAGEFGMAFALQTNSRLSYEYEYQGNNGRLVVTPLTDRCYLTLTTALTLHMGGSPQGPAGTGKTETVKDLGKALGKFVVVFNCSDKMDQVTLGGWFSGLAQTGAWGCFDEFNRILIEVLSVVTQQIHSIFTAVAQKKKSFNFEGREIALIPTVGVFITMNPGYAGRTELPDNLKALFRPVAMMVPDSQMIAEVFLQADGFTEARVLAQKVNTLYNLMLQQFSKQDHYDFNLRAIISVLRRAGVVYRENKNMSEELVMMRALKDMNLCKLIASDAKLFNDLFQDLFPNVECPEPNYGEFQKAVETEMEKQQMELVPAMIKKVIQLYEALTTRHGNMIVGMTCAGKTAAWSLLEATLCSLSISDPDKYNECKCSILNPKAVSMENLYGFFDPVTRVWCDGVLSTTLRKVSEDESKTWKIVLLDGPVDTLWIESMNTVLDDNKVLTLINGDRIALTPQVLLLFEVPDLSVASPATVSRAGMVYVDQVALGWRPFVLRWIKEQCKFIGESGNEYLLKLFDTYIDNLLEFKRKNCHEPIPIENFNAVKSLCNLFQCLATKENGLNPEDGVNFQRLIEHYFIFCMIWTCGGAVDEAGRVKIDAYIRQSEASLPPVNLVYDFYVDPHKKTWEMWKAKLSDAWRPTPGMPFADDMVPTIDTYRNNFIVDTLQANQFNVAISGATGTGKSVVVKTLLRCLDPAKDLSCTINFSSATKALTLQHILDTKIAKHHGNVFHPAGGRNRLVCFIDDLNMPARDEFGSQPPIELLRQWMEYKFWFDLERKSNQISIKLVEHMQIISAMALPGGSRSEITPRFQSKMNLLNFTFPGDQMIIKIFTTIFNHKLNADNFDSSVKSLSENLSKATLELYKKVVEIFLPTPSKCHYLFNLRHIASMFQGMLQGNKNFIDNKESLLRLWVHEAMRVFYDRLVSTEDKDKFTSILDDIMQSSFECSLNVLNEDTEGLPIFTSFHGEPNEDVEENGIIPYQMVTDREKLIEFITDKLDEYNMMPQFIPMNLVLFDDAIGHVCHIYRIIIQERGNALLVGVGGSGRQSLTRLSSYLANYRCKQIDIAKGYKKQDFYEDLKLLFIETGQKEEKTTFLFNDTQLVEESFLEDINNLLSSGEIPGLFPSDELQPILDQLRPFAEKAGRGTSEDNLYEWFIHRSRQNLHLVFCMSPIGKLFQNSVRMYPSLVNCTTIKWFQEWPSTALKEVAQKFLINIKFDNEQHRLKVADVFCAVHTSVSSTAIKMALEVKRHTYVTPTSYLSLVKGYRDMLKSKRAQISGDATILINGLNKIDQAKQQVAEMTVDLEKMKLVVSRKQIECEKLLVQIISQQREADEKRTKCEMEKMKTSKEAEICRAIEKSAAEDLARAMPALQRAVDALNKLTKDAVTEVKTYATPPPVVALVLSSVMTLFGEQTDWGTAKKCMNDSGFLNRMKTFDKDKIGSSTLKKIKKFTCKSDFNFESVKKKSIAAAAMCDWVCAMEVYAIINREVEPKRLKLRRAQTDLATKQESLNTILEELKRVEAMVAKLQTGFDASEREKKELTDKANELETKLTRAGQLVNGLSSERARWEQTIEIFKMDLKNVTGDSAIAAACLSYCGPFGSEYRDTLRVEWNKVVKHVGIPLSANFDFSTYLADATEIRNWNIMGLPTDLFSCENGVLVTKGGRWPLMVDPQSQANKWVKNLMKGKLQVVDPKIDFMRVLEGAVMFGTPVLMQDVGEELDASMDPILLKDFIIEGNRKFLRLGEKTVEFNEEFKFFITTRLANPHYSPEVCVKTMVVNFAVKQKGLEDQLLGIVVEAEEPKLEEDKSRLVISMAESKKTLKDLENEILRLLSEAKGSLLDDTQLIDTLQKSKITSESVKEQLAISIETEKNIDAAREKYRGTAVRASILYFVLIDLGRVDPMYQFSLEAYILLYKRSIQDSRKLSGEDDDIEDRIDHLNEWHTKAVYNNTCRGLFEKHKLLFAFHMCIEKLKHENKINHQEYSFFLRGGLVMDRNERPPNENADWVNEVAWDNITELDKLPAFRDLVDSFAQNGRAWKTWFTDEFPEKARLPGDWDNKLDDFQHMVVLRSLRSDRVVFAAKDFISSKLGAYFIQPPALDLKLVYKDSNNVIPVIFVLSAGSDPTNSLRTLANQHGKDVKALSLGAGQDKPATQMLKQGLGVGDWVLFANCHLSISWMPSLEQLIENYCQGKGDLQKPHKDFRLWLSCKPHPKFPITILQRSLKITTEPPSGLKMNVQRLYGALNEEKLEACSKRSKYKKLLFSLCWFHSILLERRKFGSLGWNILYGFTESDFHTSQNILCLYLDTYSETPWEALKYLIAEVNYGGRVTDDRDRRLLRTYVEQFFCEEAIKTTNYQLSELATYFIPDDGKLQSYIEYVSHWPDSDHPYAFGQHPNADMSSHLKETGLLLDTVLGLQAAVAVEGAKTMEETVLETSLALHEQIPETFDLVIVKKQQQGNDNPQTVVLLQEIERYNKLLTTLETSLFSLERGIQGLMVITPEVEAVCLAVYNGKVPDAWKHLYPSLKPLGTWMRDLIARVAQLRQWADTQMPYVFWLSGFSFPTGFLTALMQSIAREKGIAIDHLSWDFNVLDNPDDLDGVQIKTPPKEGAYIKGMFLEGAGWNFEEGCLCSAEPMKLFTKMPVVHFKPVDKKRSGKKYAAPVYLYPIRTGSRENPSFVCYVDLKPGEYPTNWWILRGTALLLSLED